MLISLGECYACFAKFKYRPKATEQLLKCPKCKAINQVPIPSMYLHLFHLSHLLLLSTPILVYFHLTLPHLAPGLPRQPRWNRHSADCPP